MIKFSNYYCLVILLFFRITTCKAGNSNIIDLETAGDSDGSADDVSGSELKFDPAVCELPIDEGDCKNESLGTKEDSDSDVINELYKLNDLNELIDLNELNESNERSERNERHERHERNERNERNERHERNERNERHERNESSTLYFGYNKNTKKCEQFNFDGCGGNENRFDTVKECRNRCYTPLKKFLAKVSDLLEFKITNGTSELPAT